MNHKTQSKALGQLSTLEGFKDFIATYHGRLHQEISFPPLGRSKALQIAAHAMGYSAWQAVVAAESHRVGAEAGGCYSATHYRVGVGQQAATVDLVGPVFFHSAQDCLDHLIERAETCDHWWNEANLPNDIMGMLEAHGRARTSEARLEPGMFEQIAKFTPAEKARFIEWYFAEMGEAFSLAGLSLRYHAPGEEGAGSDIEPSQLASIASAQAAGGGEAKTPADGRYTLWYYEAPRGDHNVMNCIVGPYVFDTAGECLSELMEYVEGRIDAWDSDEFCRVLEDVIVAHGMEPDDFMDQDSGKKYEALFRALTPREKARLIRWFFEYMDDDLVCAEYHVRFHANGEKGSGKILNLDDLADAEERANA